MSTLFIFDFDDTLALTNSHVIINDTLRMDSREFAKYRPNPTDKIDFTEFMDVTGGDLIDTTIQAMEEAIAKHGIENVFIVTARSKAPPVKRFLQSMSISTPEIVATSGSANKARWLINKLMTVDYDNVVVYEDCKKNILMLKDVVNVYNSAENKEINYSSVCVVALRESLNDLKSTIQKIILKELINNS